MILDDLVAATKERVEANKKRKSIEVLRNEAFDQDITKEYPFRKALKQDDMAFILEVKKASPSKGRIVYDFDFKAIAREYENIGANAISVLTEPDYFQGDDDYLREIARIVNIPVIRKDFIIDEYMIYEAKILGASAVLLIAAILDEITLNRYLNLVHELGMDALVETHSSMQIKKAIRVGAKIIGVNNRDLRDFTVSLDTSIGFAKMIPDDVVFVSESGIKTAQDVKRLRDAGVDAVLIGETMMKSLDKKTTLEELKGLR